MDELFGASYPPSDHMRETRVSRSDMIMRVAAASVGLAGLVGSVWVLARIFASQDG